MEQMTAIKQNKIQPIIQNRDSNKEAKLQNILGHFLWKDEDAVKKQVLMWNPRGREGEEDLEQTWKRTVEANI